MYYAYLLKNLKDGDLYIGRTNNLQRRIAEHNRGAVRSTKARVPFVLLKTFETKSEQESVQLERECKKGYKREEIRREFNL